MLNLNAKLKTIFILTFSVLLFSGCAKDINISGNKLGDNLVQSPKQASLSAEPRKEIKILFVGDTMFDRYIRETAEKHGGDYNYPLLPVKDFLSQFDLVVANLEGPITDNSSRSIDTKMDEKSNLVFTFDPKSAKALADNNIRLVSLGNNHILNQGESGLAQTRKYLDTAGVEYFGDTGNLVLGAPSWKEIDISGVKLGFANYNYSVAGSFEKTVADIGEVKKQTDIVIVYPHWGTEFKVGEPGENIQALAHQFIDAGADAIIGTHPHVIQTNEEYNSKKIYYSLGNFVFDQYFQKETTEGLGVILTVEPDLAIKYDTVKFEMMRNGQTELVKN
jgi:poly-gamma-glutamate synthesis protein (capsule biosynthesis protein)